MSHDHHHHPPHDHHHGHDHHGHAHRDHDCGCDHDHDHAQDHHRRAVDPPDYLDWHRDYRDPSVASVFDEASLWSSRFGALLLENVPLAPNMKVLDLGCGTGFPLYELAHVLGPSSRLWGADIWREAVARAQSKQDVYKRPNVAVTMADGARLPFATNSFDLIVSNLGVNNFDDAPAVFDECARVIKIGGTIAITTNVEGHMAELYHCFRHVLEDIGNPAYLERLTANEKHRGTREGLMAMLQQAGFTPSRATALTFTMRYLDGSALLRHYLTLMGFLGGWKSVIDEADRPRVFAALEDLLNHHAHHRGELHMSVPALYLEAVRT